MRKATICQPQYTHSNYRTIHTQTVALCRLLSKGPKSKFEQLDVSNCTQRNTNCCQILVCWSWTQQCSKLISAHYKSDYLFGRMFQTKVPTGIVICLQLHRYQHREFSENSLTKLKQRSKFRSEHYISYYTMYFEGKVSTGSFNSLSLFAPKSATPKVLWRSKVVFRSWTATMCLLQNIHVLSIGLCNYTFWEWKFQPLSVVPNCPQTTPKVFGRRKVFVRSWTQQCANFTSYRTIYFTDEEKTKFQLRESKQESLA